MPRTLFPQHTIEGILPILERYGAAYSNVPSLKVSRDTLIQGCNKSSNKIIEICKNPLPNEKDAQEKRNALLAAHLKPINSVLAEIGRFKNDKGRAELLAQAAADYLYGMKVQFEQAGISDPEEFNKFKAVCIEQWCGTWKPGSAGLGLDKSIIKARFDALDKHEGYLIPTDLLPADKLSRPTLSDIIEKLKDENPDEEELLADLMAYAIDDADYDIDINKLNELLNVITKTAYYQTEVLDKDGNPVLDAKGKPTFKQLPGMAINPEARALFFRLLARLAEKYPQLRASDAIIFMAASNTARKALEFDSRHIEHRSRFRLVIPILGPAMLAGVAIGYNMFGLASLFTASTSIRNFLTKEVVFDSTIFANAGYIIPLVIPMGIAAIGGLMEYIGKKYDMPKVQALGHYLKITGTTFSVIYGVTSAAGYASFTSWAKTAEASSTIIGFSTVGLYAVLGVAGLFCLVSLATSIWKHGIKWDAPAFEVNLPKFGKISLTQGQAAMGLAFIGLLTYMSLTVLTSGALPLVTFILIPFVAMVYSTYVNYKQTSDIQRNLPNKLPDSHQPNLNNPVELKNFASSASYSHSRAPAPPMSKVDVEKSNVDRGKRAEPK